MKLLRFSVAAGKPIACVACVAGIPLHGLRSVKVGTSVLQVRVPLPTLGPPRSDGRFPRPGTPGPLTSSWFAGRGARVRAGRK